MNQNIILLYSIVIYYLYVDYSYGIRSHICNKYNGQPVCCPGWRNGIGAPCIIPVCAGNCGERGECIKPNTCICSDRRLRFSCREEDIDEESDTMQLDQAENQCPDNCNEHGTCESGACICQTGYSGRKCETKLTGACYTSLKRGLCVNPMQYRISQYDYEAIPLTHEICCNALGIAWGEPCQICQITHCSKGYEQIDGICKDINECEVDGVCQRGQCINEEGSYKCNCPENTQFDKTTLDCVYKLKMPCESDPYRCHHGGKCIDLPSGDYKCICPWGTRTSQDRKSCIEDKELHFDICQLYKSSVCKNGQCIPRGNTYECVCNEGFEPSEDRKTCQYKVDICSVHRGYLCTNGQCIPAGRDFFCECNPGFTLSYDRRRCMSKCEELGPSICPNGYCIALSNGDYECQCEIGYQSTSDHKKCIMQIEEPNSNIHFAKTVQYYKNKYYGDKENEAYEHSIEMNKPKLQIDQSEIDDEKSYNWWQSDSLSRKSSGKQQKTYSQYKQLDSSDVTYEKPTQLHLRGTSLRSTPCGQDDIVKRCNGGICLNLGGDGYFCECLPSYLAINGGRACVKHKEGANNVWQNDESIEDIRKSSRPVNNKQHNNYHLKKDFNSPFYQYQSPCNRNDVLNKCQWGTCLNLGRNSYKCDCLPEYQFTQTEGCIRKINKDSSQLQNKSTPIHNATLSVNNNSNKS
uniref:Fibrillin-2-like n=1 Tax=Schistosoma mansoni TaxID=6183 RepID=A0A3Q0KBG5_SCHMA